MKVVLVNATCWRDADVRRAVRAALAQTAWPRDKAIYVGCWPQARGVSYSLPADVGIAVYVGPRAALWEVAEVARIAIRRQLGAGRRELSCAHQAPPWCVEAGLVGARPRAASKSGAARRLERARARARDARAGVREMQLRRRARIDMARNLSSLGADLEKLGAR